MELARQGFLVIAVFAGGACSIAASVAIAQSPARMPGASVESKTPSSRAAGVIKRTPWTYSHVSGSPDPPLPYDVERVFPALKFQQPVDIASAPGSDRLFVVEENGKIYSFRNRADVHAADLAFDAGREVPGVKYTYALAFHPRFRQNRLCYVCCIRDPELKDGSQILRFKVTDTDPPTIDAATRQVVISWLSGGHNGCCLKFGHDGCLYISTGDGSGPNPPDPKRTGQDLSDLLSSILRIDVDHTESGRNYRVPPDNPFVSLRGARLRFWAYGLRNPWRMSVDRKTGDLWVGDVGWELWEMIYRIERGGNYGWSVMEGRQPANSESPRGPTPILPPLVDHPHSEAASITDGATYYGSRLPELAGAHIYGDYVTGKIWGLHWEQGHISWRKELAATTLKIVGFGEDDAGELFLLDHGGGGVHRIVRNPEKSRPSKFPRRLSETGLFASVADQKPAPGVIRYSINAEPWDDGAVADRFVGLPGTSRIDTSSAAWQFPKDAVLAKTLSLKVGRDPAGLRRMETQILHNAGTEWRAYTYRWNTQQTDAELIDAAGADSTCDVADPSVPSGRRKQNWHFASRAECLAATIPGRVRRWVFKRPNWIKNTMTTAGSPRSWILFFKSACTRR